MFLKKINEIYIFVILILFTHFLVFNSVYLSENIYNSGKDAVRLHYASKILLFESLKKGEIPVFTDKMFGGYPIFFDLERGMQNIINIVLVYFFGPYDSFKILFLICYLVGNVSFYLILKNLYKVKLITIFTFVTLYFYSSQALFHLQHQNIILSIYLLPLVILLTLKFLNSRKIIYILLLSFTYYFLATLGSLQTVFLIVLCQGTFLYVFSDNKERFFKDLSIVVFSNFIITVPSFYYFFQMYLDSVRTESSMNQGNLALFHFPTLIYPYVLGNEIYLAKFVNLDYLFMHEYVIYFSGSLTIFTLIIGSLMNQSKAKKFLILSLILFLVVNLINLYPFSFFRYWVRGIFIIYFAAIFLACDFIQNYSSLRFSLSRLKFLGIFFICILFNFLNKDFKYIFINSLNQNWLDFIVMILIVVISIYLTFKRVYLLHFLILIELVFFGLRTDFHLFITKSEIDVVRLEKNDITSTHDDYTLLKQGTSFTGYSQLIPRSYGLQEDKYSIKVYLITSFILFLIYILFLFLNKRLIV